jgi:Ferritin-like
LKEKIVARRLTKHLLWTEDFAPSDSFAADVGKKILPLTDLETVEPQTEQAPPKLDIFIAPRDRAVYLLHIGAEVEHALMVQYLYAAYSLDTNKKNPEHRNLVEDWKSKILEVAREEMGHLVTVENLLTLIGGPLSFEREDYPIPADLYPFPFELEPLTKKSLGKYVLCEMPDDNVIKDLGLTEEMEEIREYVTSGVGGVTVNRVGALYQAIAKLFTAPKVLKDPTPVPPEFIASSDIQSGTLRFQVKPDEWGLGYQDILIETAVDRTSAINAIAAISQQGEGNDVPKDLGDSHFGKFLEIYRDFPDEKGWKPSRNVATNPTTDSYAPRDSYISNKVASLWAGLLNLRYRMLLMYLMHSFQIETPLKASGRTPRGLLVSWAFGEMYNIRSITEILMTLPLNDDNDLLAGPPFEMPYSLALAARSVDRWRTHRDLLIASQQYVEELSVELKGSKYIKYLNGLKSANDSALAQVQTLIGG